MVEAGKPISVVAQQLYAHRDEFVVELVGATKAEIRVLDHDTRMVELLTASITEVVVAGIHYLDLDISESAVQAPNAALTYARALAQRDVSLSALIRAYRIGQARFLDAGMRYASALSADVQVPTIVELVNRSARFIDLVCDQVGIAYEQERDRWVSRRSGLRQQWVSELLAGVPVDLNRAEEALRYRLDGRHLAAVLWADVGVATRDVVALFDHVRSGLAAALDAVGRPLMVPTDEREARLWFSMRSTAAPDAVAVRVALESSGAWLAFGGMADGLDGFRRSLRQAERAKAVVLAGRRPQRLAFYAEVAPIALMADDPEALRAFVGAALGELAVDDERTAWLRETLREFLARSRSYVTTADAMMLHRNTIQYRVTQAMELCGRSLDDPDTVVQVQIALEVCRWMAPAVLRPPAR